MKIVQINTFANGSTGSIMMSIHKSLLEKGYESYVVWGRGRNSKNNHEIRIGTKLEIWFHVLYARLTGKVGLASKRATKNLVKKLETIKPDIIHLHNIHGYYINIKILFDYIKNNDIKVIWTLHDCWPFTGKCPYFEVANCYKWKTQCRNCPQLNTYPKSFTDYTFYNYKLKKELFNIKNMTIVTPSIWLSNIVKSSFLKDKNIVVINNGIDTKIFKILKEEQLYFRKKYNLQNKKIILGVASPWTARKGLKDFIELSKIISDDYKIVLVGLSKKQIKKLPLNILGIERTNNVYELVDIYNSSDLLFNPTYEDNYPTVNLEAVACGLPIITYNTGGSSESAFVDGKSRICIEKNLQKFPLKIINIDKNMIKKVNKVNIDREYMIDKYIELYKKFEGR